jgi:hypothetical protein
MFDLHRLMLTYLRSVLSGRAQRPSPTRRSERIVVLRRWRLEDLQLRGKIGSRQKTAVYSEEVKVGGGRAHPCVRPYK